MDTTAIVVVGIFALVIIAAFFVYRTRVKAEIRGPLGAGLKLDASNDPLPPTPGVRVEDAKSRGGGLVAEDRTGRGADVKGIEVQDDILVSSAPPPNDTDPKA